MKDLISNLSDVEINRLVHRLDAKGCTNFVESPRHFWPLLWELYSLGYSLKANRYGDILLLRFFLNDIMYQFDAAPGRAICEAWLIFRLNSIWLVW